MKNNNKNNNLNRITFEKQIKLGHTDPYVEILRRPSYKKHCLKEPTTQI